MLTRRKKDARPSKSRESLGFLNPKQSPAVVEDGGGATSQQPKCYGACRAEKHQAQHFKSTVNYGLRDKVKSHSK